MKKLLLTLLLLVGLSVSARELVLVSPGTPGGGQESTIRKLQALLETVLNYPVIVEYHPGGDGAVAANYLLNANQPSRIYIMIHNLGSMMNKSPIIVPISYLGSQSSFMAVRPDFKTDITDCQDTRPIFVGTPGGGNTAGYMMIKMLEPHCSKKFINVPYKGGSQAIVDVLAGNIDMFIGSYAASSAYVQAGTLKIAAEIGTTRSQLYNDVPMFRFDLYKKMPNPLAWYVFATKNTDTRDIEQALETIYNLPEFQEFQQKNGVVRQVTAKSGAEQFIIDADKLAKILQKQVDKTAN